MYIYKDILADEDRKLFEARRTTSSTIEEMQSMQESQSPKQYTEG